MELDIDTVVLSLHIYFLLAVRKHAAACAVFNKIPPDSPAVIERQWKAKVLLML